MAPDPALLERLARVSGGFELDNEQAEGIAVSLAAVEQTLARVSAETLRAEEAPLEFTASPDGP